MGKELPVRKKNRLKEYDYSSAGYYFITICVEDRRDLFGTVGDAHPGVPSNAHPGVPSNAHPGVPDVELNEIGEIIKQHIDSIPNFYQNVRIDKYVIMPNHIHMIIVLETGTPDLKNGTPDLKNGTPDLKNGTPGCASPTKALLPKILNAFKSITSRKCGKLIWQRGYHDHIIRDEKDYLRIYKYIDENPAKWAEDEYYR